MGKRIDTPITDYLDRKIAIARAYAEGKPNSDPIVGWPSLLDDAEDQYQEDKKA